MTNQLATIVHSREETEIAPGYDYENGTINLAYFVSSGRVGAEISEDILEMISSSNSA